MDPVDNIYTAAHDYEKEREDVLSFSKGDQFRVMQATDERWWAVKSLRTQEVGYVPSSYLTPSRDAIAKRLESEIDRIAAERNEPPPPTQKPFGPAPPDDVVQIEPKKVPHPVSSSKDAKKLHKELQLNHKRGGAKQLGVPELQKVMDRRKPDSEGRIGTITGKQREEKNLGNNELALHLRKQSQKLENASKQQEEEEKKPEFMKISLKSVPS
ncbi:uncharacterized protein [Oscarella lobularis]|uniref:uncharacterized protein n=1 Tax=Oscarella lobularis TaxID=121494 RepID=UPI0033135A85